MTTTPPAAPGPTPPPRKPWHKRTWVRVTGLLVAAPIAIGIIASAAGGSHPATATPAPPASSAPASPAKPAQPATPTTSPSASSPAPAAPATTAPAAPATSAPAAPAGPTVSQQQALDSAKSYLDMGTGFSRAGLIGQLSSSSGDQFSVADATWAVDHSGADWYAQAVMSAKGYMKMGGFSRASLIDQLTSSAGEQFTLAQATYAVNQVGL